MLSIYALTGKSSATIRARPTPGAEKPFYYEAARFPNEQFSGLVYSAIQEIMGGMQKSPICNGCLETDLYESCFKLAIIPNKG